MLKNRRNIAQSVADQLMVAELALDDALTKVGKLMAILPQARIDAGVAAEVGNDAIDHTVGCLSQLNAARQALLQTHSSLSEVKIRVGLREFMLGGLMPKPSSASEHEGLRVVGRDRAA